MVDIRDDRDNKMDLVVRVDVQDKLEGPVHRANQVTDPKVNQVSDLLGLKVRGGVRDSPELVLNDLNSTQK